HQCYTVTLPERSVHRDKVAVLSLWHCPAQVAPGMLICSPGYQSPAACPRLQYHFRYREYHPAPEMPVLMHGQSRAMHSARLYRVSGCIATPVERHFQLKRRFLDCAYARAAPVYYFGWSELSL